MGARLLFVKSRQASFIELDEQLLAGRFELHEIYQPGHFGNPLRTAAEVLRADVVVGWWASWHTFLPFTLAWLLHRPSLLIVGGFDTASEPEIGYGYQLGGLRAHLSRWIMRRARVLMTNSDYTRAEIERNTGIPAAQVHVVHHGIPDPLGALAATPSAPSSGAPSDVTVAKEPLALTVGIVDAANLERKGLRAFVQAAAELPDVQFVVAGRLDGQAGEQLRRLAPANVTLTGWLEDDQLAAMFARASVYVQVSRHEGFGVAVAEAMLGRCVPVVTNAGALPEVVGDTGVIIDDASPVAIAAAIRGAIASAPGEAARERVLTHFSVEQRRDGLLALLDPLLQGETSRS